MSTVAPDPRRSESSRCNRGGRLSRAAAGEGNETRCHRRPCESDQRIVGGAVTTKEPEQPHLIIDRLVAVEDVTRSLFTVDEHCHPLVG
jgi:hypothetical protein